MKKFPVHFTHENGGTLARAEMDAVPRVGEQVNIGKTTGQPKVMIVRNVIWNINSDVPSSNHVAISLAET